MKIPYYKQETKYTCGVAALRMALACFGIKRSERQLIKVLPANKVSGTRVESFPIALEKFKFNYIIARDATLATLKRRMEEGYVVIVGYFDPVEQVGHYAVVKSLTKKYVHLLDPHPEFGRHHKYQRSYFRKLWDEGFRYDKESRWFIGIKK